MVDSKLDSSVTELQFKFHLLVVLLLVEELGFLLNSSDKHRL